MNNKKQLLSLLLVLALLMSLLVGCATDNNESTSTDTSATDETEAPTQTIDPEAYGKNEVTDIESYAVLSATNEEMRAIVAINADDEGCLTAGELQIYYWIEVYNFLNSYSYYLSYLGLDLETPLDQQDSLSEGHTWEQYFLESAVLRFEQNYALAQAAEAAGMSLPEEDEKSLAEIANPDSDFAKEAQEAGYDTAEAYLQANFGQGVTVEDYQNYLRVYYLAYDYYYSQYDKAINALTDDEIEAYFDNNAETYESDGVYKQDTIDVRHILVMPEEDEDGNVSDEALTAAQTQAQEILDLWLADPTEDYFAELANTYSEDGGSNTNGGLYSYVYEGKMVEEFNDWCFDETRAEGDYAIVQTTYGFHIMYFVGHSCQWKDVVADELAGESLNTMVEETTESYPVRFDYSKVRIYDLITENVSAE